MSDFKIDTSEKFEHLSRAPILEALIDIRARSSVPWDRDFVRSALQPQLPDYPGGQDLQIKMSEFLITPDKPPTAQERIDWAGLRFVSDQKLQIADFGRDGFTFHRLRPYEKWENLQSEALRLWSIHADLAKPQEIQRVGLRFINRIDIPPHEIKLEDYINPFPSTPIGLDIPFGAFLHIDTLQSPAYPYATKITKTIQAAQPPGMPVGGIILDIDVVTIQPLPSVDNGLIRDRLAEMRWLKNKAFFGSITDKVRQDCK